MITDTLIYIFMAVMFLLALFNVRSGKGLIRLLLISFDLRSAAKYTEDSQNADRLHDDILTNAGDPAVDLFRSRPLRYQMELYCTDIQGMQVRDHHRSQCDISSYFSDALLEQQCRSSSIEHTSSALTALGILGTFLGLTAGLSGFQIEAAEGFTTDIITAGIAGLLSGMDTAFSTSIWGIILSLALGFLHHAIRAHAEESLDLFVDTFHMNVLRDNSAAALNELVDRMGGIRSSVNRDSKHQLQMLEQAADQFALRISDDLQLKFDDLRRTMELTTREQDRYNDATRSMTVFMKDVGAQMKGVTDSFIPVIEQTRILTTRVQEINQSLEKQTDAVNSAALDSAGILAKQAEITQNMVACAGALDDLTANVTRQVQETVSAVQIAASCSTEVMEKTQAALESHLQVIAAASSQYQQGIQEQYAANIDGMHTYTSQILEKLPVSSDNSELLGTLVDQNSQMLLYQIKLLEQLERMEALSSKPEKKSRFRRLKN